MRTFSTEAFRQLDQRTIEDFGVPVEALMERAALGVTEVATLLLTQGQLAVEKLRTTGTFSLSLQPQGKLEGKKILILCGKGNNGGDGLATARQLWQRGADIGIYLTHPEAAFTATTGQQLAIVKKLNIPILSIENNTLEYFQRDLLETNLIIDAVFGTGFSGDIKEPLASFLAKVNEADCPVLAIDIPSGINGTTGEATKNAVKADITVTFHALKTGLTKNKGKLHSGTIVVWDIGLINSKL